MENSIIKLEIKDTSGAYDARRGFEIQLPCTDAQFAALVAAISDVLCPTK